MDAKTRKVLRDHDRGVTTALESVSSLITDAYRNPDPTDQSPWNGRPDQDVLQIAQIGAAQAIALSIRSLTAHLIIGLDHDTEPSVTATPSADFVESLDALHNAMCFDSRDWGMNRRDAWLYGIVVGWDLKEDDDPVHDEGAMDDIAARHGWNAAGIERLRRLHASIASARVSEPDVLHPIPNAEPPLTAEQRRQRMCPCTTEPVVPDPIRSVRHLAEGSTFWAKQHGDRQLRFWFLAAGSGITSLDGILAHADSIDASTIRDVTPPPATPTNTGARRSTEDPTP